jgi:competence protein ComGD
MGKAESGFTLVESLIVLTGFFILISISLLLLKPQYSSSESEAFLIRLQADLLYGQQYAISHQREVTVNFFPDKSYYYLHNRVEGKLVVERYYSENVKVSPGSLSYYFKFLPDGNVNKFGSLYIEVGKKRYRLTVLIGKGRFYVTEE